jgi:hypothetical protein
MDRLDAMEMFVAAIDEGSLAAGTRRLGRSPAAVTREFVKEEEGLAPTVSLGITKQLEETFPAFSAFRGDETSQRSLLAGLLL